MERKLATRWDEKGMKNIHSKVFHAFYHGIDLNSLKELGRINGMLDLRGYKSLKNNNGITNYLQLLLLNIKTIKKSNFEKIDLSFSDLQDTYWENCHFSNCVFIKSYLNNIHFTNVKFENIIFENCNLSNSVLNNNKGINSGEFRNVDFINCNISKSSFSFPIFDNCKFINCNLLETDFNGSRFRNCTFTGVLDSVFFRGYSIFAKKDSEFKSLYKENLYNRMENIDFSKSILKGVIFSHSIDLSQCVFNKNDENQLIIFDSEYVFNKAKDIIKKDWQESLKRQGVAFIEDVLYNSNQKSQNINVVDKYLLTDDGKDAFFGDKLFSLLKNISQELK